MDPDLPTNTPRNTKHDYDIAISRKLDRLNEQVSTISTQLIVVCVLLGGILGTVIAK